MNLSTPHRLCSSYRAQVPSRCPPRSVSAREGQGSRVGALLNSRAIPSMKPARAGLLVLFVPAIPRSAPSAHWASVFSVTATTHWLSFENQVNFRFKGINKQVEQEGKKGMEQKVNFELNSQCSFGFCPGLCIQGLNKHKRKKQRF